MGYLAFIAIALYSLIGFLAIFLTWRCYRLNETLALLGYLVGGLTGLLCQYAMKLSADPSYFFIGSNVTLLLLYLYLRYVHSEITSDRTEAMNLEQLRTYKPQILAIAGEHGVGNVRVFGSVVRGEADGQSDVDFLVSLERLTGWKFFGLWEELEKLLGCEVDIVTDEAINRHIRDRILNEAVPL